MYARRQLQALVRQPSVNSRYALAELRKQGVLKFAPQAVPLGTPMGMERAPINELHQLHRDTLRLSLQAELQQSSVPVVLIVGQFAVGAGTGPNTVPRRQYGSDLAALFRGRIVPNGAHSKMDLDLGVTRRE